jgi:hypothetical protein
MNRKIAVAIIIILSVVAMTLTTTKANTVMQSITPTVELGPEIIVADLGYNQDGFEVRGQVAHYNGEHVIIIDDAEINRPDVEGVIFHEMGHIYDHEWSEAQCDQFAAENGHPISSDAYSGGI